MEYIDTVESEDKTRHEKNSCIFCAYPQKNDDAENLILVRGKRSFVILNRYPYSTGHLMVVPYRHTSDFISLAEDEILEIFSFCQKSVDAIKQTMSADGFNIGINLGKVAGAGIDSHIHFHIVPRWHGDTNFMSVTAETKVLPEALRVTRERLLATWNATNVR
jgi:ATP adenylyltransferase